MKIGILTHYYHSLNYGGMLQAYALTRYLNQNGLDTEQICYQMDTKPFEQKKPSAVVNSLRKDIFPVRIVKRCRGSLRYRLIEKPAQQYYSNYRQESMSKRRDRFQVFQDHVPHSVGVFNSSNIDEVCGKYDVLITGSDQVWNFEWFNPAFYLEGTIGALKIAYAASAGKSSFSPKEQEYLKKVLADFTAISVREKDLIPALHQLVDSIDILQTVDPTLLLHRAEWEAIASERLIDKPYLFCYFLHNDKSLKNTAERFARKHGLKIVTIPFPDIEFNEADVRFGSYRRDDADPEEFLSLIKYAEYVFTDSFHATVFSLLFQKQFVVFPRGNAKKMGNRIQTLLSMFGYEERYCLAEERDRSRYITSLKEQQYDAEYPEFEKCRQQSIEFLKTNIGF